MATILKQLAQFEVTTVATSFYSPPADTQTIIKSMIVVNHGVASTEYTLYHDDDGTTYDDSTTLISDLGIAKGEFDLGTANLMMNNSNGNLAIKAGSNDRLTITIYGAEISE